MNLPAQFGMFSILGVMSLIARVAAVCVVRVWVVTVYAVAVQIIMCSLVRGSVLHVYVVIIRLVWGLCC